MSDSMGHQIIINIKDCSSFASLSTKYITTNEAHVEFRFSTAYIAPVVVM